MRKAVTTASRRSKEKRKDDEPVVQQTLNSDPTPHGQQQINPHHHSTTRMQPAHMRDRDDQFPAPSQGSSKSNINPNNNNVTGQEQRKLTNEEAALQSKNYRLAKELSEVRVRHREECKHVTRLTMENMNLASRCREAMSHVAIIKKELSIQKKKAAEAIAMQQKLTDQLAMLLGNQTPHIVADETLESNVESQNKAVNNIEKDINDDNNEESNPRTRVVSEDNPALDNTNEIPVGNKSKKGDSNNRTTSTKPTSPIPVTDVVAELDRMDQILAEHKEKTVQLLSHEGLDERSSQVKKSSDSSKRMSKESRKQQSIVEAIISHQQLSSNEKSEHGNGVPCEINDGAMDTSEHKSDDYLELLAIQPVTKMDDKSDYQQNKKSTAVVISPENSSTSKLVASDDYEEADVEITLAAEPEEQSFSSDLEHPTAEETTENLIAATKEMRTEGSPEIDTFESQSTESPKSHRKKYFPFSASPKIELPIRSGTIRNHYNEEFPEDITPSIRKASADFKIRHIVQDPVISEDGESTTSSSTKATVATTTSTGNKSRKLGFNSSSSASQLMSSIDAFEASFNAQFPESFSVRETSIVEESEEEVRNAKKPSKDDDIYDPFSTSPVRIKEDNVSEALDTSNSRHRAFVQESALPLLLPEHDIEKSSSTASGDPDRRPLLNLKVRTGIHAQYEEESYKDILQSDSKEGRELSFGVLQRKQLRKSNFFDPPGRDRTSPRLQPSPITEPKSQLYVDTTKLKDPPPFDEKSNVRSSPRQGRATVRYQNSGLLSPDESNDVRFQYQQPADNTSPSSSSKRQPLHDFLDGKVRTVPFGQTASPKLGLLVNRSSLNTKKSVNPETESKKELQPFTSQGVSFRKIELTNAKESVRLDKTRTDALQAPSSPDRSNARLVADNHQLEPARPEKRGFDLARAKYDRALGLSQSNKDADRLGSMPKEAPPSYRTAVEERLSVTNGLTSKAFAPMREKEQLNGTWTKSSKLGMAVNSIGAYFSSSVSRSTVDEGEIPMVSKLSPDKSIDGQNNYVGMTNPNRLTDSDITPTKLMSIYAWQQEGEQVASTVGSFDKPEPSMLFKEEIEGDDNDDIIEITKHTPPTTYDHAAANRFNQNATKQNAQGRNSKRNYLSKQFGSAESSVDRRDNRQYLDI